MSMSRRERALAVFEGRKPDRIPTCFWHHFPDTYGQAMVDAHINFYNDSCVDIMKMMCDEYFFYPIPEIKNAHDWALMRPQGRKSKWIEGQVERAAQIVEALHGDVFSVYNVFAPFSDLKHAYGDEQIMADLRADEQAVRQAMDIIAEDNCILAERILKETGVDGIFMIVQNAEASRFSKEEYRRIVQPSEEKFIRYTDTLSKYSILHMCGWAGCKNQLDLWKDYPAPVVNLAVYSEGMTLKQGKEMFPDRVIMGGFDRNEGTLLHSGTPEEVRSETLRMVKKAGSDRLIISADCSLPLDVPCENLRAVVEALENL